MYAAAVSVLCLPCIALLAMFNFAKYRAKQLVKQEVESQYSVSASLSSWSMSFSNASIICPS
jgi:hypothetical protein